MKALNERRDARITRAEPNLLTPAELYRFLAVARERWPQHYALILVFVTDRRDKRVGPCGRKLGRFSARTRASLPRRSASLPGANDVA